MKVRITDLLDNYYDDSIKLDTPEQLARKSAQNAEYTVLEGQAETNRFGLRQAMTIAAALMLVLMGGLVLYLRLSGTPAGASLDGENASWQEDDPEADATLLTEPTPEAAQSADAAGVEILTASADYLSYVQRGNTLTLSYDLYPVPEEFVGPTAMEDGEIMAQAGNCHPEAAAGSDGYGDNTALLDDCVQFTEINYYEDAQILYITATVDLAAYEARYPGNAESGYCNFITRLWSEDRSRVVVGWHEDIPLVSLDSFSQGENPQPEATADATGNAMFPRIDVNEEGVLFYFETGQDSAELTPEQLDAAVQAQNREIERFVGAGGIVIHWLDESRGPTALQSYNLRWSGDGTNLTDEENVLNYNAIRGVHFDGEDRPDPLGISWIEVKSWSELEDETESEQTEAEDDTDGESTRLTADDLDYLIYDGDGQLIGTVKKLVIDRSSDEYIWYVDYPELSSALPEPSSDGVTMALQDEEFYYKQLAYSNAALDQCFKNAELVFDDGTSFILGDGNARGFSDDLFTSYGKLPSVAEDYGLDITGLTPAYLLIDGERFDFK